ncbi:hypothetical protein G7054_g8089 [Neopestalotiopsis clavispora]|nr:hypothetical protein G7054_g8089 [Neopestalotiopsis clavispora]
MDGTTLSDFELEKLNEQDKQQLRTFLNNENQKARVQSMGWGRRKGEAEQTESLGRRNHEYNEFLRKLTSPLFQSIAIHSLTDVCWNKCITGTIKSGQMDKNETSCMVNCADRFLDASSLTMKHLQSMRQ